MAQSVDVTQLSWDDLDDDSPMDILLILLNTNAATNYYQIGSHIVVRRTISNVCSGILNQGQ
jgi:hypothetical protein